MKQKLKTIYNKLLRKFGPQNWWPAEEAFEVIVGAILTQNTNWKNVEKAIESLKKAKLLKANRLFVTPNKKLAQHIRSAGYYNIKAKRLKSFLEFFFKFYKGNLKRMAQTKATVLRRQLLEINGIGSETADSILLYAFDKPIFVVDAYTKRILIRHGFIDEKVDYDQVQTLFMRAFGKQRNAEMFNQYHALIVRLGKEFCLKSKPKCDLCPLKGLS